MDSVRMDREEERLDQDTGRPKPRRALGDFLRSRRLRLRAEDYGIAQTARRRTPGLRREEVASLAGIGVDWYTRLEIGYDVRASRGTLLAVATALKLSKAELDYLLELSQPGHQQRSIPPRESDSGSLRTVVATVGGAAVAFDRYLTPVLWNAAANALLGYTYNEDPFEMNVMVRYLRGDERLRYFYGEDFERVFERAVGLFRRAMTMRGPTEFALRVYEFAMTSAAFQRYWDGNSISATTTPPKSAIRHHAALGDLAVNYIDLYVGGSDELTLRVFTPASAESEAKFLELRKIGTSHLGNL
jgi:transcriptional regulator with XRE-family HTH domain